MAEREIAVSIPVSNEDTYIRRMATKLQVELALPGWGIRVEDSAAYQIAERLFGIEATDEKLRRRTRFDRAEWENGPARDWVQKSSIASMYTQMAQERPDCLPVALPKVRMQYYQFLHPDSAIPQEVIDAGTPWDFIEVEWIMYIRKVR